MSVNQGSASAAADGPPSKEKLTRILKFFNVVNALFLAITGVVSFLLIHPDFSQVLCACYVIFFSLLLLCFECHLSCLDAIIYRNFGFMFNWGGRLVFLFLNGVLAFTLDTMGYVAGGFDALVILVNMFILCRYRDFGEEYEREFAALRDQAAGKPARQDGNDKAMQAVHSASAASMQSGGGGGGGGSAYSGSGLGGALVNAAVANPEATIAIGSAVASNPHVQNAASNAVSDMTRNPFVEGGGAGGGAGRGDMTEANGWKKYLDDKSGKYYFYNERTKETKWDTDD